MRKSLLMTSALGLVMPALAMASSVAGSSAAACGSGFFAQFDAKIMNAKLEIKNEKGAKSTVPADEETDADKIKNDAAAGVIAQIKKASLEILFNEGTEATKEFFVNDLLALVQVDKLRVDAAKEIGRVAGLDRGGRGVAGAPALNVGTEAEKVAALRVVGREVIADPAGNAAAVTAGAKIFDNIVSDVVKLLKTVDPSVKTGSLADAFANNFLVTSRPARLAVANTTANAITDAAKLQRSSYSKILGDKNYIINTGGVMDAPYIDGVKTQLGNNLDNAVTPATLNNLKASPIITQYAKTAAEDNVKLNASYAETKKLEIFDRRVHHHALAGGVGATVGWWQNLGGFALSISGSGDYLWGTFRMADDASGATVDAKDKRKLGFGFQGDVGVHYVVSPSTTLGVLVGLRGQQLSIGRTNTTTPTTKDSKGDYASKWMINPVVSMQARTFFTDTVYGALSVGYIIPIEKDYKLENTNITNKDAKIRLQGLTGAFSVGMVF